MRLSIVAGVTGVLGLIAAAVGFGGPYWVGLKAQHYYDHVLRDQLGLYNIDPKNMVYRRGWFDSNSRITIPLPKGPNGRSYGTVALVSRIHHGPMLYEESGSPLLAYAVVDTTIDLPPDVDEQLHRYFGHRAPVRATTVVGFDGTSRTYISSPSVSRASPHGDVRVKWSGIDGTVTISHDKEYTFDIAVPRLLVKGNGGVLDIGAIQTSGAGHKLADGLWWSRSILSLAKAGFDSMSPADSGKGFHLSALTVSGNRAPNRHGLSSGVDIRLGSLDVAGERFGPGQYTMEVRNISRSAAAQYLRLIRRVQDMRRQGRDNGEIMARLHGNFSGLADDFLKNSPQLEISRASLATAQGEVAGRLLLNFDGNGPFDVSNVPALMGRLHGQAQVAMPEPFFKALLARIARRQVCAAMKARGQPMPDEATLTAMADNAAGKELKMLTDSGLIATEGGRYAAALSYDQGRLTVNGHPVGPAAGL